MRQRVTASVSGQTTSKAGLAPLTLGALGVVYGDIGTSPLYAFRETFHAHKLAVTEVNVIGACSLVIWALILVVSIKYLAYVLRADNKGEGGILALTSMVAPRRGSVVVGRLKWLVILGLFGTALLYGDGVITPAISVLSAVEGLGVVQPTLKSFIMPIAVLILVGLFAVQKRGTGAVGRVFGPIMILWFLVIGGLGLWNMLGNLEVLKAFNPIYGLSYLTHNGMNGFLSLGSVFLVVTGGEALYADMGHFGRTPIRLGWFSLAFPCLMLTYLGMSALVLKDPAAIESPLFLLGPDWARPFLVGLATLAAIIASQALISGAFSMTVQAVQLDYLPRLAISHTSAAHVGQVYVSVVNWLLMAGSISLVLVFGSSANLAAAYGIAVTGTMAITTLLMAAFVHSKWKWPLWKVVAVSTPILVIDMAFFLANVAKIPDGGWFPIVVAITIIAFMTTWRTGRQLLAERIRRGEVLIDDFLDEMDPETLRVPGTAVFLFKGSGAAPPALLTNSRHNHVIHERVILLSVRTSDDPYVDPKDRAEVVEFGQGFFQVTLSYGFFEEPDVQVALLALDDDRLGLQEGNFTYFLGRETVIASPIHGMADWRERLFAFQLRSAAGAARFFKLPAGRVVEVGSQVEI
ncbi:MAG TPA: potassium transporter Kup [Microthrixaceae bacterium]|nr:potassium transporter Kup [Microthrixaceae bacterium]